MIHALGAEGRRRVAEFVARGPLFTFDIDGTLAPIAARPEDARVPDELQKAMAALARAAKVAVLTGRGRDDARRMLAFEPAYVLGNHGIEGLPGSEPTLHALARTTAGWHAALEATRDPSLGEAGILLEDKRYSLSLHYRNAPDQPAAVRVIAARAAVLAPAPKLIQGKCVVNLLPPEAPHKGDALRALLSALHTGCALYAGDDETDEHVFDLPRKLVLGVRVGRSSDTRAALYVDDASEMLPLIDFLLEKVVPPQGSGGCG
jgi:trehalose 6-phosphate phosphatase